MSGPGDIDGEVSGDEAAWRELIAHFDDVVAPDPVETPWPSREDLPDRPAHARPAEPADPADTADPGTVRQPGRQLPYDRLIATRPAGDPRSYSPPDDPADARYLPAPLPPPGKLDAVTKAAWAAVVGGPAYLLVVSLFLHLSVSPLAAFIAVAAFVGGFVTLVIKLGDHSDGDDDDDGAVL